MDTRVHRLLEYGDIMRIADTYHEWRMAGGAYKDVPGFCKSATRKEIEKHEFVLNPGLYVEAAESDDATETFEIEIVRLSQLLEEQMMASDVLDERLKKVLSLFGGYAR